LADHSRKEGMKAAILLGQSHTQRKKGRKEECEEEKTLKP